MNVLQEKFYRALESRDHNLEGIGTLGEKSVHATLKHFLCEDHSCHEILMESFVADVVVDKTIYEIQSGQFNKLRSKILNYPLDYDLHIVYPIDESKTIIWLNELGEEVERRKSPKKGNIYDVVRELYKIRPVLKHRKLTIDCIFIDVVEYRLLDGWDVTKKKRATKLDRVPVKLNKIISLSEPQDYRQFLPPNLPQEFMSRDIKKLVKLRDRQVSALLLVLREIEIISVVGKQGNAYIYAVD